MNLQAIAVGFISLVTSLGLFLLEKTTPKNLRVPVKPFFTYSHESVRISIILLFIFGIILIAAGLIL